MLQIILLIIKILFSVLFSYAASYFLINEGKEKHFKEILSLSIVCTALISTMNNISINNNDFSMVSLILLLCGLFYMMRVKKLQNKFKAIYFLSYFAVVSISFGYIANVFIVTAIYYYLYKNMSLFNLNDNYSNNEDNIKEDKYIDD